MTEAEFREMAARTRAKALAAEVFAYVRRTYGFTDLDLTSHRRLAQLIEARKLVVRLLRAHGENWWSYPKIGRLLGGRHHTTIMYLDWSANHLVGALPVFARHCGDFACQWSSRENRHAA